jgi:D-3-phosphoglycerate dehydrogenase
MRFTPHSDYGPHEGYEIRCSDIFDQIFAYTAGAPTNVVNPNALR